MSVLEPGVVLLPGVLPAVLPMPGLVVVSLEEPEAPIEVPEPVLDEGLVLAGGWLAAARVASSRARRCGRGAAARVARRGRGRRRARRRGGAGVVLLAASGQGQ